MNVDDYRIEMLVGDVPGCFHAVRHGQDFNDKVVQEVLHCSKSIFLVVDKQNSHRILYLLIPKSTAPAVGLHSGVVTNEILGAEAHAIASRS